MKVALLKNFNSLGKKGEVKEVSAGYARNFLFPQKLAILATDKDIERLKEEDRLSKDRERKDKATLDGLRNKLSGIELMIKVKSSPDKKLFAGLSAKDVSKKLSKLVKEKISPEMINLEKPIKYLGEYKIPIKLSDSKSEYLKTKVISETKS